MKDKFTTSLSCVVPHQPAHPTESPAANADNGADPTVEAANSELGPSPTPLSRRGSLLAKLRAATPWLSRQSSGRLSPTASDKQHPTSLERQSPRPPRPPLPRDPSVLTEGSETPASNPSTPGPSPSGVRHSWRVCSPLHRLGKSSSAQSLDVNRSVDSVEFPSMAPHPREVATRRWFDWKTRTWHEAAVDIKLQPLHFAGGKTCTFHFLVLIEPDGAAKPFVARRRRDGAEGRTLFESDCVAAATSQSIADAWNALKPVYRVYFLDSFLLRQSDGTWLGVEPFLPSRHTKLGGNRLGLVELGAQKHHQAFSHFSHEYTAGQLLIVGFRGTGEYFRHPTVLSRDGQGFGVSNTGQEGMDEFFRDHWCNSVCAFHKLETHLPGRFGRRLADVVLGDVPEVERYCVSDFVGDVRPLTDAAQPEELTVLGLTAEQFNRLVHIFRSLDLNKSYTLKASEVQHVFAQAQQMQPSDPKGRAYIAFAHSLQQALDARGQVTFKHFLLCWTNNYQPKR